MSQFQIKGTVAASAASRLDGELHALSQPLSSLQCRLEIGLLYGDEASAREALEEGLRELVRVNAGVARIRGVLLEAADEDGRRARASR